MEIEFTRPNEQGGMVETSLGISEQLPDDGPHQSMEITLWVTPDPSGWAAESSARNAAVGFLERALQALRQT